MSVNKEELVEVRNGLPSDRNFILATWLRGLYYGNSWFQEVPKDLFMAAYHAFLERLLNNPGVVIKVACLKEDQDVILGYSVSRSAETQVIMDWVFVKTAWRGIGIAKSLTPAGLSTVTHLTKIGRSIKPKNVVFNPFV